MLAIYVVRAIMTSAEYTHFAKAMQHVFFLEAQLRATSLIQSFII